MVNAITLGDVVFGNDVLKPMNRGVLDVTSPIGCGIVTNWDDMERLSAMHTHTHTHTHNITGYACATGFSHTQAYPMVHTEPLTHSWRGGKAQPNHIHICVVDPRDRV